MEPKFQTSFIPKKPIGSSPISNINIIHTTNNFSVLATVIFLIVLLASGGLFLYKIILTNQITDAKNAVIEAREAFEPEKIRELIDVNSKIVTSSNLLENHIIVSKIFVLFEDLTLKKMRISDFNYSSKDGSLKVLTTGEAQTYNALAEQQNVFTQNPLVKNPTFSNFRLEENGYVGVSFSALLDKSLVSYKKAADSVPTN